MGFLDWIGASYRKGAEVKITGQRLDAPKDLVEKLNSDGDYTYVRNQRWDSMPQPCVGKVVSTCNWSYGESGSLSARWYGVAVGKNLFICGDNHIEKYKSKGPDSDSDSKTGNAKSFGTSNIFSK